MYVFETLQCDSTVGKCEKKFMVMHYSREIVCFHKERVVEFRGRTSFWGSNHIQKSKSVFSVFQTHSRVALQTRPPPPHVTPISVSFSLVSIF